MRDSQRLNDDSGHLLEDPSESGEVLISSRQPPIQSRTSFFSALSDDQVALVLSGVLLVIGAWPLFLLENLPYQDLPNHLATLSIIENPERYPELVFNGFLKTNSLFFLWLVVVGKPFGGALAAKLFSLMVLAATAFAIPRFVLAFANRQKMIVATFLAWPMVHNWFVSMGMLDFAFSVPLSMFVLILLQRQLRAPSVSNAISIVGVGILTWYTHVFSLLVVFMLAAFHLAFGAASKDRWIHAKRLSMPLAPVGLLSVLSILDHLMDPSGPMAGFVQLSTVLPTWELCYNLWAEWAWGFSKLSITSLVPCLALAYFAIRGRHDKPLFFTPKASLALIAVYAFSPYIATNWFHVNSRLIPFIYLAMLLRVPSSLPKVAKGLLAGSALLYSAGMGIDFVRLEKERKEFVAGIPYVEKGATLLPLVFHAKYTSENTRSLLHNWGYYVVEKQTSAPLLFAHSRSFPITYKVPPPLRFNHLILERSTPSMANPAVMCAKLFHSTSELFDCEALFHSRWREFWQEATPRYDHVLLWDPPPEARAEVPPIYRVVFESGRLVILSRADKGGADSTSAPPTTATH